MVARHLLSVSELADEELMRIVDDAVDIARGNWDGRRPLLERSVGLLFRKTSTRTRTSFAIGAQRLGAHAIMYGPSDLQSATGETAADTARVLANYLDA